VTHPSTSANASASIIQTNIIEATLIASPSPSSTTSTTATAQFHATTDPDTELCLLDAVAIRALKCQDEICSHSKTGASKQKGNSNTAASTSSSTSSTPSPSSNPQTGPPSQPQYHYLTPIEDPTITQNVIQ
jgi:hypothetical protein